MKKIMLPSLAAGIALPASALPQMPQAGFNGSIRAGFAGGEMDTNFLARLDGFQVELSDERIDDLGSPGSEDLYIPLVSGEVGWTFGNERTRVSVGNDYTDPLQFDRATIVSLRHDFESVGQFRLDGLINWGFETLVWRDPYRTERNRRRTDQSVNGGRLIWDRIFTSGFGVDLVYKERDVNTEQSGDSLDLAAAERKLLERDGDVYYAELNYHYQVDQWHSVVPGVAYVERDLDGKAMAQEGVVVGLEHLYLSDDLEWQSEIRYTSLDGEETNPIFGQEHSADGFSMASRLEFRELFGAGSLGAWSPNVFVTYAEEDSKVNFNDTSIWTAGVGVSLDF